jgi:hypothetical protein
LQILRVSFGVLNTQIKQKQSHITLLLTVFIFILKCFFSKYYYQNILGVFIFFKDVLDSNYMNDMRLQQQQLLNGHRNSNFSTETIVKKRNNNNNTGGSFSLAKNEIDINNEEETNVNSNEFTNNNYHHKSDDIFQQSAYESQYPEDMIGVQVFAKMQEESEFKLKFQI